MLGVNIPSIRHDDKIYSKQREIQIHYNITPSKTGTIYLASLQHSSYKKLEWDQVHRVRFNTCSILHLYNMG